MSTIEDVLFIFLDDVRDPPSDAWTVVRTAGEAYQLLIQAHKEERPMVLSLDHDLGEGIPTGYDLLNWIEKDIATDQSFRPEICFQIHSANPVGRDNMARAIGAIEKMTQ